jgi:hypothetical protein
LGRPSCLIDLGDQVRHHSYPVGVLNAIPVLMLEPDPIKPTRLDR